MGEFEVDLFPEHINNIYDPKVEQFKLLLEQIADDYGGNLTSFKIKKGTVSFSFDNEELTAEVVKLLQNNDVK